MSDCRFCSTVPAWVEMLRSDAPFKPENRVALADWMIGEQARHDVLHAHFGFIDVDGQPHVPTLPPKPSLFARIFG